MKFNKEECEYVVDHQNLFKKRGKVRAIVCFVPNRAKFLDTLKKEEEEEKKEMLQNGGDEGEKELDMEKIFTKDGGVIVKFNDGDFEKENRIQIGCYKLNVFTSSTDESDEEENEEDEDEEEEGETLDEGN